MTPRKLVTAIAIIFVGCVVASIATGIERPGSLRFTHAITALVFVGLAVGLSTGLVRGSRIDRWFTVVAAVALAAGIFVNSGERPATGLVILGATFCLCAVGLLTPFAGRHFAKRIPVEPDGADQTAIAPGSKPEDDTGKRCANANLTTNDDDES